MDNIATAAAFVVNNTFWQQIPAAVYVLLGVIISGAFAIYTDSKNRTNNKELKELENKNNKELKELENKNNKEIQAIEINHKEKLQNLKEKGDRALRLLDDKIKIFTEFHENFSTMRSGASIEEQLKHTIDFRKTLYKVKLLTPNLKEQLSELDIEVINYANYFHGCLSKSVEDQSGCIRIEKAKKVIEITEKILKQLAEEL